MNYQVFILTLEEDNYPNSFVQTLTNFSELFPSVSANETTDNYQLIGIFTEILTESAIDKIDDWIIDWSYSSIKDFDQPQ